MDSSPTTSRHNPATRAALIMALAGTAFLVYAAASWMGVGPGLPDAASAYTAVSSDRVIPSPAGRDVLAVLASGFALLLIACALLLRSRQSAMQSGLRDPVTGLYTALYAAEALPGLIARDDRAGHSRLVLVRVHIDAIDDIRQRYGGRAVDLVMGTAGRVIVSQTREDDLPVEPDDDGFAVFLHCEEVDQAKAFCRRLATLLRSEQLDWNGDVIKVSASTRVVARGIGESIEALQHRAHREFTSAGAGQAATVEA